MDLTRRELGRMLGLGVLGFTLPTPAHSLPEHPVERQRLLDRLAESMDTGHVDRIVYDHDFSQAIQAQEHILDGALDDPLFHAYFDRMMTKEPFRAELKRFVLGPFSYMVNGDVTEEHFATTVAANGAELLQEYYASLRTFVSRGVAATISLPYRWGTGDSSSIFIFDEAFLRDTIGGSSFWIPPSEASLYALLHHEVTHADVHAVGIVLPSGNRVTRDNVFDVNVRLVHAYEEALAYERGAASVRALSHPPEMYHGAHVRALLPIFGTTPADPPHNPSALDAEVYRETRAIHERLIVEATTQWNDLLKGTAQLE